MAGTGNRAASSRRFRVAIIGVGFSGLAAAAALRKVGIDEITLFERSPSIGGTWWENVYPGCEVDTPSHLYSFSFARFDWTRSHPRQPEILAYLEHVVDHLGLRPQIRLNTAVASVAWSDRRQVQELTTEAGERLEFEAVISAVGFFNAPRVPNWPGRESFTGEIFHSARWPAGTDLRGKAVGVVGTGSTAVQIVAEAAKLAKSVTVFQRDPNWVVAKNNRALTEQERARLRIPLFYRLRRLKNFIAYERMRFGGGYNRPGSEKNARMQEAAVARLRSALAARPDIIDFVTPNYPFHGKRTVVSDHYYETLLLPHVSLAPSVVGVAPEGLVDDRGTTHALDVVALATGFEAASFLSSLKVTGREGRDLHAAWQGEPAALLGVALPGFPNFFMMYGPNTNGSPVVYLLESQAEFVAKSLRDLRRSTATATEVDPRVFRWFNSWLQDRLARTTWATTSNYFKAASGRIVTQWPFTGTLYWVMSRALRRISMRPAAVPASARALEFPRALGFGLFRLLFATRKGP